MGNLIGFTVKKESYKRYYEAAEEIWMRTTIIALVMNNK